jgi:hypothetical protein
MSELVADGEFYLIDYLPLARELRDTVHAESSGNAPKIVPRLDAFVNASRTETLHGDTVLEKLYLALDSCGLKRTSTQRLFHKQFVQSVLPWVYGKKDFARYKERILFGEDIHPDKYNQYTLISTPRRWGKTTSVGIFVAAMLFTVPDAWISVYSTGKRASKALSDLVLKFVLRLEEAAGFTKSRVLVKNTEELFYAGDIGSDKRQLYSYPATVQAGFQLRVLKLSKPTVQYLSEVISSVSIPKDASLHATQRAFAGAPFYRSCICSRSRRPIVCCGSI